MITLMQITMSPLTKKIALTCALILFVFSCGLFYINKILLPIQARAFAIKAAQDALKRNVTFDTLQYSPLRGFVLTDLVIFERDDPSQVFFKADAVSAQVLFPALLQKKLIIPSLRIEAPELVLTRTAPDAWNFSDLMPAAGAQGKPAPITVLVSGFAVINGKLHLNDAAADTTFSEIFNIPMLKGSVSWDQTLGLAGDIVLPSTNGTLKFDTHTGIKSGSFQGAFRIKNIPVSRFLRFAPAPLPVTITNLVVSEADITALVQKNITTLAGNIDLLGLDITAPDVTTLQTDLKLTKLAIRADAAGISAQGSALAGKTVLKTPAGLTTELDTLRTDALHIMSKKNVTTANAGLVDIQGFSAALDADKTLSGNVLLNRLRATVSGPDIQAGANIEITDAKLVLPDATVTADIAAPGTQLNISAGKIDAALQASFNKLTASAKDLAVTGTPRVSARITVDPAAKPSLICSGTIDPSGIVISGLPVVGEIKDIKGSVTLEADRAWTQGLAFNVLGSPVTVSGTLTNFQAPQLSAAAKASGVNLALMEKFLPDAIKARDVKLSGAADIDMRFDGILAKAKDAVITATAKLTDAGITAAVPELALSAINGTVTYTPASLAWQGLSLRYHDKTWSSDGSLEDLANPAINALVKTDGLSANIQAQKTGDTVTLDAFSGTWFDSNFNITGSVLLLPEQSPVIDLGVEIKLSLRDLPNMLPPAQAKQVSALKLAGIVKVTAEAKGPVAPWQELASTISVETPAFYMMGYQIADLAVEAIQREGRIDPLTVQGTLYGGAFNAEGAVDLRADGMPFTANLRITDTILEQLKKDTPLKNRQMSGLLSATADAKGTLKNIRAMTGSAAVKIVNGYLWELEILSRVLTILSSTFQGGDVIITDADATFKIADQKVTTDNLTLRSATVTLVGEGWVDLDHKIEMNFSPRIEPRTSAGAVNPLEAINPTAGIVNIRVFNTLEDPKFEHNISAPQIIKKTLQNTVGSILQLFK